MQSGRMHLMEQPVHTGEVKGPLLRFNGGPVDRDLQGVSVVKPDRLNAACNHGRTSQTGIVSLNSQYIDGSAAVVVKDGFHMQFPSPFSACSLDVNIVFGFIVVKRRGNVNEKNERFCQELNKGGPWLRQRPDFEEFPVVNEGDK